MWFNGGMSTATATAAAAVTPQEAGRLVSAGKAYIVDVREVDEHRREHVAGASLLPSSAFSVSGFPAAQSERLALVLCRSGGRAGKVAAALVAAGRSDVRVIEGGITGWERSGMPVVRDAKAPMPIIRQVMIAAGTMVAGFTVLAVAVDPWFLLGTGFVGAGLAFAGISGFCPMATVIGKMPWNRPAPVSAPAARPSSSTCGTGCCS